MDYVTLTDIDGPRLARDRVRMGIDRDISRSIKQRTATVQTRLAAGRVGCLACCAKTVADPLSADLHQHGGAVMRPLLDDTVRIASNPDIVLGVDETAMDAMRQDRGRSRRCQCGIAPTLDNVPGWVV